MIDANDPAQRDAYLAVVRKHAGAALHAALRHDSTGSTAAIDALIAEAGGGAVVNACLCWADTLIDRVGVPEHPDGIVFLDAATGDVQVLSEEDYPIRWSARWLIARRRMDEREAERLLAEAQHDGDERRWTGCVLALLSIVSANLSKPVPQITDLGDAVLAGLAAEKLS